MRRPLLLLPLLAACDAPADDSVPPGDSEPDSGAWTGPDPSTYRTYLESGAVLGGLMGENARVKYTAPIEGREREEPIVEDGYFQDMVAWPWHMQFLCAFPELRGMDVPTYEAWVIQNDTRRWWGGELRFVLGTPHPLTKRPGILVFTFWADDSAGGTAVAHVAEVAARMATVAPWAAEMAVWSPDGSPQQAFADASGADLDAAGLAWLPPERVIEGLPVEVLSAGEAEGALRLGKAGAGEILVAEAVPAEAPALAGLLVGVASAEDPVVAELLARGAPVAVLDPSDNAVLVALDGAPVRIAASDGRLTLLPLHVEVP